jgi:hypothetical protein
MFQTKSTPCSPLKVNGSFGRKFRLHIQGRRICRGTDKSLIFPISYFKNVSWMGYRSDKDEVISVWSSGENM